MSGADAQLTSTTSTANPGTPSTPQQSEAVVARRVADKHGLNHEAFAQLIAESRAEARRRRRRVSDTRLDELVQDLGMANLAVANDGAVR